jgi:hypothetical protein
MEKLKKLVLLKQKRDRIDRVGAAVAAGATERSVCSSVLPSFPFFFISSASAASIENISQTWWRSPSVRIVLITAAVAPLPPIASLYEIHPTSSEACMRRLFADVIVLPSPETFPIIPELIELWLECITKREVLFAEALTLESPDDPIVVPVYFVKIPMQDNGSQRLGDVMRGVNVFLNGCCATSGAALGSAVSANTAKLRQISRAATVTSDVVHEEPQTEQVGILVHCLQGISRSVSVVIWYLVEALANLHNPPTVDGVLQWLRCERPCACPNLCFAAELTCMERRLHKKKTS